MIIRKRPSAWRLFFVVRGSIVPQVSRQILATMLTAALVTYFHDSIVRLNMTFTAVPFTIIGLALSIFLGFRNSTAYDRYWEGRRLWGELTIACRSLARQVLTAVMPVPGDDARSADRVQRAMIYDAMAFAHALRHHLRDSDPRADLAPLLGAEALERALASVNPPEAILRDLGQELRDCLASRRIAEPLAANIDDTLGILERVLASCERIKTTPVPFSYTLLLHRTAYLYCFLLPFGLVDTVGLATPIVVGLVSYTFFGLDALGDEIEEPFGTSPNDLPLSALSRIIEINLREALGEADLPEPLLPRDFHLS
ncbi:bestrophin family protein [Arenibaculum pallidiluteum]|uniref:bestrophin family protein n=1 Tax=Arenibaculum pallidiluteum TaxID=2812559 RepID=UPI001A9683B7|nr:bestrophin family ion channel [Arenibaculum pallidiluteum]